VTTSECESVSGFSQESTSDCEESLKTFMHAMDPDWTMVEEMRIVSKVGEEHQLCRLSAKTSVKGSTRDDQKTRRHLQRSGEFSLDPSFVRDLLAIARSQDVIPTVDAFASHSKHWLEKYWTKHTDAFKKDWTAETLWINPPEKLIPRILEKILEEEAQGILIVPVQPQKVWFHTLSRITTFWWDVSLQESVLTTIEGQTLPPTQQWRVRVVFFNAFQALQRVEEDAKHFGNTCINKIRDMPMLKSVITDKDSAGYDRQVSTLVDRLSVLSEVVSKYGFDSREAKLQLSGVIESAGQNPASNHTSLS